MNKTVISIVIIVAVIVAGWFILSKNSDISKNTETTTATNTATAVLADDQQDSMDQTLTSEKLIMETLQEGTGEPIKIGQIASVNYTGTLVNGKVFDSSIDPAFGHVKPFVFTVGSGNVIQGWDLGVLGMKVGEKRKLTIAPELAYGSEDKGIIPPNSTLIFEVELVAIQ
ncbi:MAG: hypothetical protein RL641_150 [Candidatus Parcubacteria bacterium]|jgi:FKBP-type peptidyl-prolyl cis-trans isomerase